MAQSDLCWLYRYAPLSTGQDAIRVLELLPANSLSAPLQGRLYHTSAWRNPDYKYTALSYVWGPPARVDSIVLEGQHLGITASLSEFLRSIRKGTESLFVWADAICIRQWGDLSEKGEQVQKMDKIYKNAFEVIGWLGDRARTASIALPYLRHLAALGLFSFPFNEIASFLNVYIDQCSLDNDQIQQDSGYDVESILSETLGVPSARETKEKRASLKLMFEFMNTPYWSRLWIVQEVTLNRKFSFRYGHHPGDTLPPGEVEVFTKLMIVMLRLPRVQDNPVFYKTEGLYDRTLRFWTISATAKIHYPLPASEFQRYLLWLYTCDGPEATNPLDYIYGLYGLFKGSPVPVDYNLTPRQLYLRVLESTQHESKNLHFLSQAWVNSSANLITLGENKYALPHYAVDYSSREDAARSLLMWANRFGVPLKERYKASRQSEQQVEFYHTQNMFRARGFLLSKICAAGSTCFITKHENTGAAGLGLWPDDWSVIAQLGPLKAPPVLVPQRSDGLGPDADSWHTKRRFAFSRRSRVSQNEIHDKLRVWWRTVMLDTAQDVHVRLDDNEQDPAQGLVPPKSRKELEQLIQGRRLRHSQRLDRRKMFRAEDGYIGLGPPRTEVGDVVVILYGGCVPYILRPSEERPGAYVFVGDCFVQDIMDGQAMNLGREETVFEVYG